MSVALSSPCDQRCETLMANPYLFVAGVFMGAVLSWAATSGYYRVLIKREMRDKYVQLSLAQSETEMLQRRLQLLSQSPSGLGSSDLDFFRTTARITPMFVHKVHSATSHRS